MMYSQQEYDMVRRQTMQIEAEKRAVLRLALIVVTVLLAASLLAIGWMYRRYSAADSEVKAAEAKAAEFESKFQETNRELAEKKATLDKYAATAAKQNDVIESVVPRMLNRTARDTELAELAHAIFQQPGRVISLPSIPPDSVLRRYRVRIDGQALSYVLVAGQVDGKWVLYSNLLRND
jgi:Tfp pilus assembly protein PilO